MRTVIRCRRRLRSSASQFPHDPDFPVTPRLPAVRPKQAVRALERCGWQLDRSRGSHQVFRHPNHSHRVVVPMHGRDLARGTLDAIIDASGVSRDEFIRLL